MPGKARESTAVVLGSVAAVILFAGVLQAQRTGQAGAQTPAAAGQAQMGRGQMESMMAERQKMMTEMAAAQKKLDDLIASMNAATGADKIDRVAAVVGELVVQHKAMHNRMMSMQGGMMQEMMQRGRPAAQAPSAAPPGTAPPAEHEQHHPPQK